MVLGDEVLKVGWLVEVDVMCNCIILMCQMLVKELKVEMFDCNFDYLLQQCGMFSYIGLSEEQVDWLCDEFGVYLIVSGCMCVVGFNVLNVYCVVKVFVVVM